MLLFPYSTDAPLAHRPYGTIGLVALCVVVFVLQVEEVIDVETQALAHGDGLHPLQWISATFLHGGFMHLAINMMFLWVFGMIVEGKIGTGQFLACFFGIGILQNATEQILFLGGEPSLSLGASAAIYGLIGMSLIWAPRNDVSLFYWILIRAGTFAVSVRTVALFYIGVDLAFFILRARGGVEASSELLHLEGAVLGLALGVVMLKRGWVDCEGFDFFSVWKGKDREKQLEGFLERKRSARAAEMGTRRTRRSGHE